MPKVLLAEDDAAIRRMYSTVFKRSGLDVLEAATGNEAVAAAAQAPDLILLDMLMPNLDGIGALKQIKADDATSHIPVVMLTNLADDTKTKEALELGADSYIIKSDQDPSDIANLVLGLIDSKKHR